jgi:AraC-like DNA-binding protein
VLLGTYVPCREANDDTRLRLCGELHHTEGTLSVPQTRFEVLDTRDPDELTEMLSRLVGRARLDLRGRNATFRGRISHLAFDDVGIIHGKYNRGFTLRLPDFNTFVGSPAPLKGAGAHEIGGRDVTVSKGCGVILSPGGATLHFGPQFEHLSMAVRPAALMRKLSAIVGDLRLGPLRFEPAVNAADPPSKRLERLVGFVSAEFGVSASLMPPILYSELQQTMMTAFLLANSNNYSGLLHGEPLSTAPWQVRRAEQFIEANWDQPITIEALAAAANVSVRSLFSSFKAGRGYSPMDFVKRVRLEGARRKLSNPDAETSVTAVAFDCGFGNPGHFARDYHDRFGERPSETLRPMS